MGHFELIGETIQSSQCTVLKVLRANREQKVGQTKIMSLLDAKTKVAMPETGIVTLWSWLVLKDQIT